ncbi:MAG: efflux RND transporter periplasmic adaptor subunit [Rhodospirillales bacterium]
MDFKRFGKTQTLIFTALAAAAVALWAGHGYVSDLFAKSYASDKSGKKKSKNGVPVIVKPVTKTVNKIRVEAIGTARAKQFVTMYPEASGEIVDFKVEAGQRVKKGQVILELDSETAKLAKRLAETRLTEAKRLLSRSQQLRSSRVNSLANVQDAQTVYERAELELAQARDALTHRVLRAPFAGVVGIPKVENGDRVTPATPIITIDNRETILVEFDIAEKYLSRLRAGQPVSAVTPTFQERMIEGKIDKIDSRVDPVSRSIRVRAAFPNAEDLLRPGISFFVTLLLSGREVFSVPQLAVQWEGGKSYVWRIVKGKAEKVIVRSVNRLSDTILVAGELSAGDQVVVEGVQRLRPGRQVDIQPLTFGAASES